VAQRSRFQLLEDLYGHCCLDSSGHKEEAWGRVFERGANPIESTLSSLPVLVCASWVDSAFQFTAGQKTVRRVDRRNSRSARLQEYHVDALVDEPWLLVEEQDPIVP